MKHPRNEFLLALDDATRPLISPQQIAATATGMLAEHLHVDRCAYADFQAGGSVHILGDYSVPACGGDGYGTEALREEFARVSRAAQPMAIADTTIDPRIGPERDAHCRAHVRALISVPVIKEGQSAGGMMVHQRSPREWTGEEIDLVRIVANRCWEAIERARITRQLLRKTRSLGLLARAGTRLLSMEDPRALIESLFDEAGEIADLELCFHFLAPDDGERLRLEVCRGVDEAACREMREIEAGQALCGLVTARRRPIVRERVLDASDDASAWLRRMGVNAYACFPLLAGDALVGTLSFGSRTRDQFDEEDVTFLQALSDQVAIAYGRARAAASLRGSEERLQQAVAIAGLGTFDVDLATDTVIVNDPGRGIYGWAPGEPITFARIQRQFHHEDRAAVLRAVRQAFVPQGGHIFDIEHRIIRTDGSERWVRARGQVIFEHASEPRAVRVIGTYLDVTARKEAEQRREASLAAERAAREHAERLGRLKDEFLATVSHELRTPLNAILGWSQLLGRREMPSEEARRAVETIRRNARAQAVLIDDLLDMNRIVSGKLRLEMHPMDLTVAVAAAIESIEPALRAKGVHLRESLAPHSATVLGDAARLQQVLWNLLTNAIKFTPAGGTIDVRLSTKNGHALIEISDTGMGIAPGFLPYIFEPFRQQDASTTRRHGGVGLGLSIVKELVELHGGSVDAFSGGEGAGTRVVVSLPMPQDSVMPPDQSAVRDNPGS